MGLFAPTGVPSEIIQKLFDAAKHASEQPDVINALNEQAAGINISSSPEDALTFVENETKRLQQACGAANFF